MKKRSRLRQARQLAGMSQAKLARLAGLKDKSAVCRIERCGSARPSTVLRLSKVLGYPAHVLFPYFPKPLPKHPHHERKG